MHRNTDVTLEQATQPSAQPAPLSAPNLARTRTGAERLCAALAAAGYRYVFCVPGGYAMLLEAAASSHPALAVVQCQDERHAGSMAEGCIRSGAPAVLLTITGPGLTGAITAIANARQEGVPLFCIGAEVATSKRNRGAAQHLDTVALVSSVVKRAQLLTSHCDIDKEVGRLVRISRSGHPGPVYLGVPMEVAANSTEALHAQCLFGLKTAPVCEAVRTAPKTAPTFTSHEVEQFVDRLRQARCPVVLVGYGVRLSGAQQRVLELAERVDGARVVTSPRAIGDFPRTHVRCLGVLGLAGDAKLPAECDLLVVLGSRLREHTRTPLGPRLEQGLSLIHVDIEASALGSVYDAQLAVQADIDEFLQAALASYAEPLRSDTRHNSPKPGPANDTDAEQEAFG